MLHRETSEARMILNHRRQFNVTKKIKNKMLKIETLMWRTFLEAQTDVGGFSRGGLTFQCLCL